MKLLTSCKEASRLISKSQDNGLTLKERLLLFVHLHKCKSCVFVLRQIKKMRDVLGHYTRYVSEGSPSDESALSEEARQRIKSSLSGR